MDDFSLSWKMKRRVKEEGGWRKEGRKKREREEGGRREKGRKGGLRSGGTRDIGVGERSMASYLQLRNKLLNCWVI